MISHIQTFRDYFHYHIKASKAFIHSRMRKRTADFLQGEPIVDFQHNDKLANGIQYFAEQGQRLRRRSVRPQAAVLSRSKHESSGRICELIESWRPAHNQYRASLEKPEVERMVGWWAGKRVSTNTTTRRSTIAATSQLQQLKPCETVLLNMT